MTDREARDFARNEKRNTPSPRKKSQKKFVNDEDKENGEKVSPRGKKSLFSDDYPLQQNLETVSEFSHPVYKEISRKNGIINKSDLSTLKKMCKDEKIDSSGKRPLIQQRLKNFFKTKMLSEVGLLQRKERYDYLLVVDFEATCQERNLPDYPHEIIEFPGVLIDGNLGTVVASWRSYCRPQINTKLSEFCIALTGIQQETVDQAKTFPEVLQEFNSWVESYGLGTEKTFALVTDGPFDVGRFLRLSCEQHSLEVPGWAEKWINLRKAFANFYRWSGHVPGSQPKLPGLQTMLSRLDLEFQGEPHCGLDDAKNIGRVVSRMILDGANLKVNEMLDPNPSPLPADTRRPPSSHKPRLSHVSPITRSQAEVHLSTCRQITRGCKELVL